jgi:predicted dehydrogenase
MSILTRRDFLKDSALFAAAAAAFGPQPSAAEEPRPVRKVGANDRIRVACIGFNGQGKTHLNSFASLPDTQVVMICDVDKSLADMGIKIVEDRQKSRPEFVQDLRRIMDRKEIDVVSIATPNHWHALAAIWAIQAGKDVYVEKPVSHNVWEGRRIVDFARRHKKIVQTGTQSRSNEGMRQTLDFIHAGKIGKVTLARGLCYKPRGSIGPKVTAKPPASVDYNLWLGPAPEKPVTRQRFHYDWHWFWDYGNGDLGNQGIHEMDKARWGLKKSTLCQAVLSFGGRFGYEDAGETANTQVCLFDYGDCQLIFEVRGLKTGDLLGAKVGNIWYGTEGYVVSSNYHSGAAFTPKGELIQKFDGGGNHYANFIKAVKSRTPADLTADIEEGHLSSALCHLGNISYRLGTVELLDPRSDRAPLESRLQLDKEGAETLTRTLEHLKDNGIKLEGLGLRIGKRLKFDPQAERFVDSDEANKLLTREYRKGFEVPAKG